MRLDEPIQRSFTGGEQSLTLGARADLQRWRTSMERIENFVVRVQGGMERCPGTKDVYGALANSVLLPFAFGSNDGYALEFGVNTLRFFRDYGVLLNGGVTYAIATPFAAGDLPTLCPAQIADRMYISSGTQPLQELKRLGTTNWTLGAAALKNGPFMDENTDKAVLLYTPDATELTEGTNFTLKAFGGDVFQAGHVGAQFLLRIQSNGKHDKWINGHDGTGVGAIVVWDGNTYKCTNPGPNNKTGPNPPVHLFGEEWDGRTDGSGCKWLYLHSGYGVATVTAFTNAKQVTAQVQSYVPDEFQATETIAGGVVTAIAGGGSFRWSEGAFSDVRGYPKLCQVHKDRLYLASTTAEPTKIWASVIDDFPNFDAQSGLDNKGFSEQMGSNTGRVNVPRWMLSSKRLAIGTTGDEHVLVPASAGPITADNVDIDDATEEGSAPIRAEKVDGPIFVSADLRRVNRLGYDFQTDTYQTSDLTIEADHITAPGIAGMAWQRDPYRLLWCIKTDGSCCVLTSRKDEGVNGWQRRTFVKGNVKSLCAVPAPSGVRQDMWFIVERALAAGTVRRIESLAPFFERGAADVSGTIDVKTAWFVDDGFQYSGAAVTTIGFIPAHLEGETVNILADGKVMPPQVVTGGQFTIPTAASVITFGLPLIAPATNLRYDKDAAGGKLAAKPVRTGAVVLDVINAAGVKAAAKGKSPELLRPSGGQGYDIAAPLYTGPLEVEFDTDWDNEAQIDILCDQPLPCTIRSMTPVTQVSGGTG